MPREREQRLAMLRQCGPCHMPPRLIIRLHRDPPCEQQGELREGEPCPVSLEQGEAFPDQRYRLAPRRSKMHRRATRCPRDAWRHFLQKAVLHGRHLIVGDQETRGGFRDKFPTSSSAARDVLDILINEFFLSPSQRSGESSPRQHRGWSRPHGHREGDLFLRCLPQEGRITGVGACLHRHLAIHSRHRQLPSL